jgi:hypothetical protein
VIDVIETKTVSVRLVEGERKNAGGKYEGIFHYVIENKWWKNVRNGSFHYVHEKKGCYSRLSIILMKRKLVIRNEGSERPFDRRRATWAFYMTGCFPNASFTQHDLVQVGQRKRFTAEFTEATEKNYPRVLCLRDLCNTNPAIRRGARRFCATGILPVLGHGQDGHGTALVAALPRCELRGECFWVAAWSCCATLLLASKV